MDGEVDQAIDSYDKAEEFGDKTLQGVLLSMRGYALLNRAYVWGYVLVIFLKTKFKI